MPGAHVLAASGVNGLILLLIAVAGFLVVVVVAVVIMGLLNAILPSGDSEADALHAAELGRQAPEEQEHQAEV
ncbi:MAG TPA: hypothetical protein VGQ42_10295 [Candidatus Dormibacteraeota bacterium]|nr:hypothetical protein [Candidatus Dormibacteraeota bacterium]